MLKDLKVAIKLGVDGIAIGALTRESELDTEFLIKVMCVAKAAKIEVTFHRAFDDIPFEKQGDSIRWLSKQGFARIAVHGGSEEGSIVETLPRLKELLAIDEDIILMVAGGVTKDNVEFLEKELKCLEAHGTKIV